MTYTRSEGNFTAEYAQYEAQLAQLNPENTSHIRSIIPNGETQVRFVCHKKPDRRGGDADIFFALDLSQQSPQVVVLRTLRTDKTITEAQGKTPSAQQEAQFLREAQVLQYIQELPETEAQGVVKCFEVFSCENKTFMVLEYLDPNTVLSLRDITQSNSIVPPDLATSWISQVCATVGLCADHGILHADIKPANLLLNTETQAAQLIDFGISPTVVEHGPDLVRGTLGYISPERLRGEVPTLQSEVFALTTCLYEMLTGTYLYYLPHKDYPGMIKRTLQNEFVLDEHPRLLWCIEEYGLDRSAVEHLFSTGLAKKPQDRFQTAAELAQACEAIFP